MAESLDSAWQYSDLFLQSMWEQDNLNSPDSLIWGWFNMAFAEMEKYPIIQLDTTIDMVVGQIEYDLPSTYVQDGAWSALYKTAEVYEGVSTYYWGLPRKYLSNFDPDKATNYKQFDVWGTKLIIIPPPSDIDIVYLKYTGKINRFYHDSSTTNIPESKYRPMAVHYACMLAATAAHLESLKIKFSELWAEDRAYLEVKQREWQEKVQTVQ